MNESDRKLLATIEQHDCSVVCIEEDGDGPPFAFSVGLFQRFGHPEVLVCGLGADQAQELINTCRDRVRAGHVFQPGFSYGGVFGDRRIAMRALHRDHYVGYLGTARWLYSGDEFPCLEAFWSDEKGLFPWDDGCDSTVAARQPRLDHAWRFSGEPVGRRVWIDRRALGREPDPVLRIDRMEESDWRFSCDPEANATYDREPLWRAVQLDVTLVVAARLAVGGTARRRGAGDEWRIG